MAPTVNSKSQYWHRRSRRGQPGSRLVLVRLAGSEHTWDEDQLNRSLAPTVGSWVSPCAAWVTCGGFCRQAAEHKGPAQVGTWGSTARGAGTWWPRGRVHPEAAV